MAFVNISGGMMQQVTDRATLSGRVVQLGEELKQIQQQQQGQQGANQQLAQAASQKEQQLKLAQQQLETCNTLQSEYTQKVKGALDLCFKGIG